MKPLREETVVALKQEIEQRTQTGGQAFLVAVDWGDATQLSRTLKGEGRAMAVQALATLINAGAICEKPLFNKPTTLVIADPENLYLVQDAWNTIEAAVGKSTQPITVLKIEEPPAPRLPHP